MIKLYAKGLCALLFLSCISLGVSGQFNRDRSVRIYATVSENPPSITLHFQKFTDATSLRVFRKKKEETTWGTVYKTLNTIDSFYTDLNVTAGEAYEYAIEKVGGTTAMGFIFAGINHKPDDLHGTIALLVDANFAAPLATEITQLEMDLIGDGWQVHRLIINRNEDVKNVKNKIKAVPNVKALFLLGNIPVPYSGFIVPDGHPDHQGAWACDGYYGDLDGEWYDIAINSTSANRAENRNIPGDGKFDASSFGSDVDLQIGRVDMTRLPAFKESDTALTAYYLEKNHKYRMGMLTAPYRAVIDDNFLTYPIASSNWRNFSPMVAEENITYNTSPNPADYRDELKKGWHMWSGGAGGGSYSSCGGVINTSQFATDSIKGIFTSLAGSYFGDWDVSNNLLRAAIASKPSLLASFWGGIPTWVLHHMALGENIGYGARLTQNEKGTLYEGNFNGSQGLIHIALMGDPTLRLHTVLPPSNVKADSIGVKRIKISWDASADNNVVGYHIYKASTMYGSFGRTTAEPVTGTTYTDVDPLQGNNVYMVRAVKKENTPSGTYYNLSQGMTDSAHNTFPTGIEELVKKDLMLNIYPNPSSNNVTISIESFCEFPAVATITNVMGQQVKKVPLFTNSTQVDISQFPGGIYFVNVEGGAYKGTVKLMVR